MFLRGSYSLPALVRMLLSWLSSPVGGSLCLHTRHRRLRSRHAFRLHGRDRYLGRSRLAALGIAGRTSDQISGRVRTDFYRIVTSLPALIARPEESEPNRRTLPGANRQVEPVNSKRRFC